jgi:RNA polymerase subunit RPABC4/transcription elongation factor Spt4
LEGTALYPPADGYSDWDNKDALPEICLDFDPSYGAQDQSVVECGDNYAVEEICVEVRDVATGAFPSGTTYEFTIGKIAGAKACVGIANAVVYNAGIPVAVQSITGRTRSDGSSITIPTVSLADYVATSQIKVQFTAAGAGSYYVVLSMAFDTCCATPGDYVIDFAGQRIPCGGSFSFTDQTVAVFSTCTTVPPAMVTQYNMVCPYGAETATSGWFNGMVVTNPNSAAITVQFVIYEEDGDMYTGSATIPANGLEVDFAELVMSPVAGGSDATFGDEAYAVYANSIDGPFYIFFLNFDGTQAQGYLGIMLPNTYVPAP